MAHAVPVLWSPSQVRCSWRMQGSRAPGLLWPRGSLPHRECANRVSKWCLQVKYDAEARALRTAVEQVVTELAVGAGSGPAARRALLPRLPDLAAFLGCRCGSQFWGLIWCIRAGRP